MTPSAAESAIYWSGQGGVLAVVWGLFVASVVFLAVALIRARRAAGPVRVTRRDLARALPGVAGIVAASVVLAVVPSLLLVVAVGGHLLTKAGG